jgi:hypothetical protein
MLTRLLLKSPLIPLLLLQQDSKPLEPNEYTAALGIGIFVGFVAGAVAAGGADANLSAEQLHGLHWPVRLAL